jgi:hypothetical protein
MRFDVRWRDKGREASVPPFVPTVAAMPKISSVTWER